MPAVAPVSGILEPSGIRDRMAVVVEVPDRLLRADSLPAVASSVYGQMQEIERELAQNGYEDYVLTVLENGERGQVRARFLDSTMPASQVTYNYEVHDGLDVQWPSLEQYWIVPRASFTGTRMTTNITAPPALGRVWTRIGEDCIRFQDKGLDGLFVLLRVRYEDISNALVRDRVDPASGRVVRVTMRKVAAGTAGQPADAQGYIHEVEPINTRWSIDTKDSITGLVGVGQRSYSIHRPYPWPSVLVGFQIVANVDGTLGFDYALKSWDDECLIDVLEYWTPNRPSIGSPLVMGPTAIRYMGGININVPPCLHPQLLIQETSSTAFRQKYFPQTRYTNWPRTITLYPSVRPHPKGGFLVTRWIVHSPTGIIV